MPISLEIDSVTKHYNNSIILSNINIKCNKGDIIGLLGRNGSGKSTLFQIIFGTKKCENKFVRINNIVNDKPFKIKNGISYLPQNSFIPKYLTVKKTIFLYLPKSKINVFIEDSLIKKIYNSKIYNLSGGELKFLEVKLLLYIENSFCLLDEPFSGVSPLYVELLKKLIQKMSLEKGIIITDHNYKNILDISNKLYFLKDGNTIPINDIDELIKLGYINNKL
jgi:lipopolysaccharide export system ATP-binding protein